jgi:hypothetical protein
MPPLAHVRTRYTYKLTWAEIVNLYRLTLPEGDPPACETY